MSKVLAFLYAPESTLKMKNQLARKLQEILFRLHFEGPKIVLDPDVPLERHWEHNLEKMMTLVIGWGLPAPPCWDKVIDSASCPKAVRQFLAIDLFEREKLDGSALHPPRVNAGPYFSQKMKDAGLNLFLGGFAPQPAVPYGLKKTLSKNQGKPRLFPQQLFVMTPGDPDEIEIVRLIFELFVIHDCNRSQICALLNTKRVKPPNPLKAWNSSVVTTILKSPFYIGANQYQNFIQYDVFEPAIEKSLFFEAQARLPQKEFHPGSGTKDPAGHPVGAER